jgi:hypothetical protein
MSILLPGFMKRLSIVFIAVSFLQINYAYGFDGLGSVQPQQNETDGEIFTKGVMASVSSLVAIALGPVAITSGASEKFCNAGNGGCDTLSSLGVVGLSLTSISALVLLLKSDDHLRLLEQYEATGEVNQELKSLVTSIQKVFKEEGHELTEEQVLEGLY